MMKAIIKATGEYVEFSRIQAVAGNNLYKDVNSGITYHPEELESIEQVRIQASIEFAAQILANHGGTPASVANNAVDYADALIKKLKGGQDEINN